MTIGPAGSYLTSLFKSNKALSASQIRPAVHQAATNIVGMLHVFIVVSLHVCHSLQSQYITLQSDLIYPGCLNSFDVLLLLLHHLAQHDLIWLYLSTSSQVTALLQVPLAIATLTNPKMIKDRLYSTSPSSTTMLAIASGYFVHDLVICTIQLSTWGPAYLLHALFCSLLYCYGLFSGVLHYYGKPSLSFT